MEGLVHGRAGQVVHGRVHDTEVLLLSGLHVQHLSHAHACVTHQGASGLNHELPLAEATCVELGEQLVPQGVGSRRRVSVVVDTQAAAEVDMVNGDACGFNRLHQIQHAVHGVEVGRFFRDLGADVAVDTHDLQAGQRGSPLVGQQRAFVGDAEFVTFEAGGDIGMRLGVDVGVDADADRGLLAHAERDLVQDIDLGFAFHVEAADANFQGAGHFSTCFSDARKNDLASIGTGGQDSR